MENFELKKSYSLDELQKIYSDFRDAKLDEDSRESRERMTKEFIEKLKREKDKFQHVFETESGSVYFVAQTGESIRFKNENGKIKDQPIVRKTFFISEEVSGELMKNRKNMDEYLLSNEITLCSFDLGTRPLEFWIIGFPEIVYECSNGKLQIKGTKRDDKEKIDKVFASGFHVGHKITNIIK
jgi:hypothetical protein